MQRISTDTADPNLHGLGKPGFTNGNPATGIPSTRLDEGWFNAVQEEISGTIETAGITLDAGDNTQLAQAIDKIASNYGFSGAWADINDKPNFATVATSGAYNDLDEKPNLAAVATSGAYSDLNGKPALAAVAASGSYSDLSGKPDLASYLAKSELQLAYQTETGIGGPTGSLSAIAGLPLAGFGNTSSHHAYADFNTPLTAWGWSYVLGTGNAPPHGGSQGGYRCRIAAASEHGNVAHEICFARGINGTDPTTLWLRQLEGTQFSDWRKVSAGNADTVGGLGLSDVGTVRRWLNYDQLHNTINASHGISSVTDHDKGQFSVDFSVPFSSAHYVASGMGKGDGGVAEVFSIDFQVAPRWDASGVRMLYMASGYLEYVDCRPGTLMFAGAPN